MSANNKTEDYTVKGSEPVELDERKMKILTAIIQNYLESGEPVGSRTISKYTDLNLSSATIRNEMADLEEMGYILQPHTSAGRIPSDMGYRIYVDNMMKVKEEALKTKEAEVDDMKEFLIKKVDKVETLLQNMAKMLATNTNYATMISAPHMHKNKIKFIQLSQVEIHKLLCVMVLEGNIIKNKIIEVDDEINNETMLKLNILLNSSLNGLALDEINLGIISRMTNQAGEHTNIVRTVIDAVAEVIVAEEDVEIYTSGATNIFKYPELSDSDSASKLISTFEEKQLLSRLVVDDSERRDIQVYIGDETPVQSMKDCSVITASYELDDGVKGTIGIIGPKRMDYEKALSAITSVKEKLNSAFKKPEE
ncbi:MAG: heat-inducible transcription repressor HrcA [Clostridiales bacterium]|nr:heat-inducible transcription repressor HrcA [Clostridiales bacterium]